MPLVTTLQNQKTHYGWVSITLHWVTALVIFGMYPLGLYIDSLSYYDPLYRTVPNWHKSIGILLAGVVVLRVIWLFSHPKPISIASHSATIKRVTHIAHAALYLLLIVVLLSGYMISTADGRGIDVFGWFEVPALPELVDQQEDIAGEIHFYSATTLIAFAGLHALAALKHHYFDKDETLKRMLGIKEIV